MLHGTFYYINEMDDGQLNQGLCYSFAFDFLYARIQSVPQIMMNVAVIQNSIRSIFTASEAVSSNISPQER